MTQRRRREWLRARIGAGAGLTLLCACHGDAPRSGDAARADPGADLGESRYAAPPQVLSAGARPGGAIALAGRASPGATLRLSAPEGEVFQVKTPSTGLWTLRVPAVSAPRMFALSASLGGAGVVHGEGALLLAPSPAPVALLVRSGSGALVIDAAPARPAILAVDCDPGGVCALSGLARPGAAVRLSLDGAPAGAGEADRDGRYAVLAASRRLQPGLHAAAVLTPGGEVRRPFTVSPPDPLRTPYQVSAIPDGWRVEWAIPGGGVQTTLVFASR